MKYLQLAILLTFTSFIACQAQNDSNNSSTSKATNTIEVIDFYSTHRCVTCEAIEANAKYTVETYFSEQVKSGKVSFKAINVDDKKNNEIAESFEAFGTALFLNVIKNGKEEHVNLTDFAFSKGRDKEVFSQELKTKIEAQLKNL